MKGGSQFLNVCENGDYPHSSLSKGEVTVFRLKVAATNLFYDVLLRGSILTPKQEAALVLSV